MSENNPTIKKCCPKCGFPFIIPNVKIGPSQILTCKACCQSSPYSQWRTWGGGTQEEPKTQYGHAPGVNTSACHEEIASLHMTSPSDKIINLKLGRNVIGRYAPSSKADIQIDTPDRNVLSREHAVIDVKEVNGKYIYKFSLYKERVNETKVAGKKIAYGDALYLKPGDIIELPSVIMFFKEPDRDETTFK